MSKVDFIDILAVETKYTCYNTEPSLNLICMAWWPTFQLGELVSV